MAKRKRNDSKVSWPYWLLGSGLVIGGIVGTNYLVHRVMDRGKPRWIYCIKSLGSLDAPIGYEVIITDPQGKSGWIRPKLEDGSYELKTWWQARNFARVYITCRGGVPVNQSTGTCPTPSVELSDACATEYSG